MPIEFGCTKCGAILRTPDGTGGKNTQCPTCGNVQRIPENLPGTGSPAVSSLNPRMAMPIPMPTPSSAGGNPFAGAAPPSPGTPPAANPFGGPATGSFGNAGANPFAGPAPQNPFAAPPVSNPYIVQNAGWVSPLQRGQPNHALASRWARLGAAFIDAMFGLLLISPGVATIVYGSQADDDMIVMIIVIGVLLVLAGTGLYLAVQWTLLALRGQTIGKKICGARVVRYDDGGPAGFIKAVLLRSFVSGMIGLAYIPGWIFQLVDYCFIFSEERRCLHDLIAGTTVVKAE